MYAIFSLVRWNDPVRSQCSVGIAGVVLVSVTVAAGLGFCAVLGIAFNASTTQVKTIKLIFQNGIFKLDEA